jgi:hypothetical protein
MKKINFTNINKKLLQQQKCILKYIEQQDCVSPELETILLNNMELTADIIEISEKFRKGECK